MNFFQDRRDVFLLCFQQSLLQHQRNAGLDAVGFLGIQQVHVEIGHTCDFSGPHSRIFQTELDRLCDHFRILFVDFPMYQDLVEVLQTVFPHQFRFAIFDFCNQGWQARFECCMFDHRYDGIVDETTHNAIGHFDAVQDERKDFP